MTECGEEGGGVERRVEGSPPLTAAGGSSGLRSLHCLCSPRACFRLLGPRLTKNLSSDVCFCLCFNLHLPEVKHCSVIE